MAFKKGCIPWNKGIKASEDLRIKKFVEAGHKARRGRPSWNKGLYVYTGGGFKKGHKGHDMFKHRLDCKCCRCTRTSPNKGRIGKKASEKTKKRMSDTHKNMRRFYKHKSDCKCFFCTNIPWNKGTIGLGLQGLEKHWNWMGGKSFEPYGLDFNEKFKKSIRNRDSCCMLCGVTFDDLKLLKKVINVHHIDYVKTHTFPQNCISLCVSCHTKTNQNRSGWTRFFQSMLNEMYDYV